VEAEVFDLENVVELADASVSLGTGAETDFATYVAEEVEVTDVA
jgi:hypothetical protein